MLLEQKISAYTQALKDTQARNNEILELAKHTLSAHLDQALEQGRKELQQSLKEDLHSLLEPTTLEQAIQERLEQKMHSLEPEIQTTLQSACAALKEQALESLPVLLEGLKESMCQEFGSAPQQQALLESLKEQLATQLLASLEPRAQSALQERLEATTKRLNTLEHNAQGQLEAFIEDLQAQARQQCSARLEDKLAEQIKQMDFSHLDVNLLKSALQAAFKEHLQALSYAKMYEACQQAAQEVFKQTSASAQLAKRELEAQAYLLSLLCANALKIMQETKMHLFKERLEDLELASQLRHALIKKELADKGVIMESETQHTKTYKVN